MLDVTDAGWWEERFYELVECPHSATEPVSGITEEMIEQAACRMAGHFRGDEGQWRGYWDAAEIALAGGLSGRVVVDLPPPDMVDRENVGYWGDEGAPEFVTSRPPNGDPGDFLHGVNVDGLLRHSSLSPARCREVAGWMLAAAQHAEPKPLEQDGASPGNEMV